MSTESPVLSASGLSKHYGRKFALDGIDLEIGPGRIVGLIGRNGAGKSTFLRAALGLTRCEGQLRVLGLDPFRERARLLEQVSYLTDVAVLPRWMRVRDILRFVADCHPNFRAAVAETLLGRGNVERDMKIGTLSKGMVTQLHLALVLAIDARLLLLDEPTLGLDIVYRDQFYRTLLEEYYDQSRTVVLTTHHVEEVEHMLTDVVFIEQGRIVFSGSVGALEERYCELRVTRAEVEAARRLRPIAERQSLGETVFVFENPDRDAVARLGETRVPRLSDLFIAKVAGRAA